MGLREVRLELEVRKDLAVLDVDDRERPVFETRIGAARRGVRRGGPFRARRPWLGLGGASTASNSSDLKWAEGAIWCEIRKGGPPPCASRRSGRTLGAGMPIRGWPRCPRPHLDGLQRQHETEPGYRPPWN
ncbi:hypothetical protein SGFS_103550 [Streptomyces graminofaciens]|uniref:Uncharacterized protein n=1 Tax=Streptomyces graminofaciens TaxID=68212 RepID=A0ABM7FMA3_9ACTN|nr:hypothetical protein SGFS_103550 [Streptomyces graminofaciens]